MYKVLLIILVLLNFFGFSQSNADDILGNWISAEKNIIVGCYKINQKYYGKVLWYRPFDAKTEARSIAIDENTKYLNKLVMQEFIFDKNEWNNGKIIDLTSNKTYTSFIKINEKSQLKVTGFVLFRWLSNSLIFEKLANQKHLVRQ